MTPGLHFKPGVRCRSLQPQTILAMTVAASVFNDAGYDFIVTSICDGEHSVTSLHWVGAAFDFRTQHLPSSTVKREMVGRVREELRPLGDYDVILEQLGGPNEHGHCEWQPKGRTG